MPASELLRLLRAQPFEPFRIHVSGGRVYEIRHPELMILMAASAILVFPDPNQPGMASGWERVDLRHIIRVEPIRAAASQPG